MEGIRDGRAREAMAAHTGARYIQHSAGVRDGVEGFVAFFEPFILRNPKREIEIVQALEDGRYVFVHVYQSLNEGQPTKRREDCSHPEDRPDFSNRCPNG